MVAVIQRVAEASVKIDNNIFGQIKQGFLVLIGIANTDSEQDLEWLANKIIGLRVFGDSEQKMNLNLNDVDGNILLISQFTLISSTKKGNRPSFIEAARPEIAIPLYEKMIKRLSELLEKNIQTGVFGADMQIESINNGPVTIIIDTNHKK
jgi:D-aminoacyl-tRNA deacylase